MKELNFLAVGDCFLGEQCFWFVPLLFVFLCSLFLSFLIVVTKSFHGNFTTDQIEGIQKVHVNPTPRIGGLAVYLALILGGLVLAKPGSQIANLLIASVPAFLAGFTEDITNRISPLLRLTATILSGFIAFLLTGHHLTSIGISEVDVLFESLWFSVAFTILAVAGIANSYNIIDGYNGLAGITASITLLAMGSIALNVGDSELFQVFMMLIGAALGFLCLNWPRGRLFLGDGGAYSLGFAIGWSAVMLVERNSTVSPFAALLVCIYPVTEVIYSIVRRTARKQHSSSPDRIHLHSLVGRRFVDRWFPKLTKVNRNSLTGLLMAGLSIPSSLTAQFWYESTAVCVGLCFAFPLFYILLYRRLVTFGWIR